MFIALQTCPIESIGLGNILIIAELAVLLWILASLVSKVDDFLKKTADKTSALAPPAEVQAPAPLEAVPAPPAPLNSRLKLEGVDEPTAAVIMAVVSHQTNIPLEKLDFKKISLVSEQ
ncbi:MAG TPA: hypothetical protein PKW24_08015 [Clostridiales bacterium]|nr:hypothetical protein [Clostridiales bacterium]HRT81563.1 hypothetical protein [Oscillospiraceae bacterium]